MKNNKEVQEHRYLQDADYFENLDKRKKEYKDYQKWKANYDAAPKGLGDVVEKITKKTGIKKIVETFTDGKDCGCDKRKEKLNNILKLKPYGCFTEDQYNQWTEFRNRKNQNQITVPEQKFIQELLLDIFKLSVSINCSQCNASKYKHWIRQIDKFYETY